ncbi:MAG TPA: hypothetical protein VJM51_08200 [Dehalococcoidia bacterium]|nr:hypothetical protein [Dehalococcoidia bacterium]
MLQRKLRELLPLRYAQGRLWEALTQEWLARYKGGAEYGPPLDKPSLVLKVLLLADLYNLLETFWPSYLSHNASFRWKSDSCWTNL